MPFFVILDRDDDVRVCQADSVEAVIPGHGERVVREIPKEEVPKLIESGMKRFLTQSVKMT